MFSIKYLFFDQVREVYLLRLFFPNASLLIIGRRLKNRRYRILTSTLLFWLFVLLIFTGLIVAFWPGVGTYEVLQFAEQRKLPIMNDWKSPFIAGIYWLSEDFFSSTGPVLIAQQALFWSGLALLVLNTLKGTYSRVIFFSLIAILPPIWITEILLWKEAWTLSCLSFSIGATFAYLRNGRTLYGIAAVLAAIMLATTRHNAILLTIPTFYVAAQKLANRTAKTTKMQRRGILATALITLLVVTLGFTWAVNKAGKQRCHIWHHVLLWDLAAISVLEDQMLIPAKFRKAGEAGSLDRIRSHFTPYTSDPLFFYERSPLKLYGTAWSGCPERPPLKMLLKSWYRTVFNHSGAYLRHRLLYLLHLFNISDVTQDKFGKAYYRIDSEYSSSANRSKQFERLLISPIYKAIVLGIPIRGGVYALVFFLSIIGISGKASIKNSYLWMLWLGGLAYLASFVIIGSGALFRYLSVYGLLGPAILAGRWGRQRYQQGSEQNTTVE